MKNMKTFFLVIIFTILVEVLFSQNIILNEEFKNNNNNWTVTKTEEYVQKIKKGKYFLKHISETGNFYSWITCNFEENSEFVIEASFKKISGVLNNGYGIIWGGKDLSNHYEFQISGDGHYRIDKVENSKRIEVLAWTKSTLINQGDGEKNILSIKRIGTDIHLYINNTYVNYVKFSKFYGDNLGFVISQNQKISVDYIKVTN
jgi:hypothetical protein